MTTTTEHTREELECPQWCSRSHGALEIGVGDVVHEHQLREGPEGEGIDLFIEQATIMHGEPVCDRPVIGVWEFGNPAFKVTGSDARRLAADLILAADTLDQIAATA